MFGKYRVPKGFSRFPAEIWEAECRRTITLHDSGRNKNGPNLFTDQVKEFTELLRDSAAEETAVTIRANWVKANGVTSLVDFDQVFSSLEGRVFAKLTVDIAGSMLSFGDSIEGISAGEVELKSTEVSLSDCSIGALRIAASGAVSLENCCIGRLCLSGENANSKVAISMRNCRILVMDIPDTTNIIDLDMQRCEISHRYQRSHKPCPPAIDHFSRVTFTRLHKLGIENGNTKLAHQARGWELSVEHAQAETAEKPFYWLWWLFSNYGLSLWRPILWLLAFVMACAALLFATGTSLGVEAELLSGWRQNLVTVEDQGIGAEILRAIVGATESVFSPFSLFSTRRMVVPDLGWVATIQFFVSYICVALLFLFGFSVRRRFKVS